MNRREFTQGLAAVAATPALPLKAIAAGSSTASAAVATAGNFTPYAYTCAVHYAQMMGRASPEILVKEFGIPASSARAITARLIKKGILLAPNAIGVSRAAQAIAPAAKPVVPTLPKAAKPPEMAKLAKELLLEDGPEDDEKDTASIETPEEHEA